MGIAHPTELNHCPPYKTGGANQASLINYTGNSQKTIKANPCGFIAIKASSHSPFVATTSVSIDGATVTFGSLPQNPTPPICLDSKTYLSSTGSTTYNGANLYRTAKAVYYVGLTPNSLNAVELNGLASKDVSQYKGDPQMYDYPKPVCGIFYIDFGKKRVPNLKIDGVEHTVSTATAAGSLSCSGSNLANLTPNTLYQWGMPFNGTNAAFIYRVADLSKQKIKVEYPTTVSRNLPVNACGFSQIDSLNKVSGFAATDRVKINGTEYTVSSLPLAPSAPMCKGGVTYQVVP